MTRKAIHTTAALLAVLALTVSCRQDDGLETPSGPRGDCVALRLRADIPAPETQQVGTRAVDPDGGGVQHITLFCFDGYGLFITTATADISSTGSTSGTFTAQVPTHTRRIHFVANQNMTDFHESSFINKSESEVMALLEGSAGHMIYWARFACTPDPEGVHTTIADQMQAAGNKITMLRNHALITVENPTDNGSIVITGLTACNINAFGTVAPYHPEKGFNFTLDEWAADDFVTIPQRDDKQSDIMDVTSAASQYIFEHENRSDDPVSIILRGHAPDQTADDDLYYRVMLIDANGDYIPVRRNHRYILRIDGALSFGQPTFGEALTAAATNNVWISISDNVNAVEDQRYILTVDKTFEILNASDLGNEKSYWLHYTVKGKNGTTITDADKPEVTWIDNTVAAQTLGNLFEVDRTANVGEGRISITLRSMGGSERLEGTLLVKQKHGRLQRKIKIVLIKKQSFVPSWIGTAVYGGLDAVGPTKNRPHVTLMFTIPETCPEDLFPMKVYISASELDIRSEAGMPLPVVRNGDKEWYDSKELDPVPDYKFVYTAEKPGPQRIYFENILSQTSGYRGTVYIEAKHFATMTRTYTFSETRYAITVSNLEAFNAKGTGEWANDENVYYYRVAQKAGAPVHFDMQLRERNEPVTNPDGTITDDLGDPINAGTQDEFLFYSQNLNNYNADEGEIEVFDCYFSRYNAKAEAWQKAYDQDAGRMLMFKPKSPKNPRQGTGKYTLFMYTNCARSAEVVRIASNLDKQPAVSQSDPDDTDGGAEGLYGGGMYRSQTFELTNYTPFRFGARVKYAGREWAGAAEEPDRTASPSADIPETVTPLTWTYEPEQKVDIAIDVTSFRGPDDLSVDPFGREFEIYIDAPMLKIDEARLAENRLNGTKLKADPSVPGRFVYTVEADREQERPYGTGDAANADASPAGADQRGERKTLPFIVNSVASAGDIVLSSNEQQVVFYAKTFRVTNESIRGHIQYESADGTLKDVPDDLFVAFERVTNSNRIGSVAMTSDGRYELRLRKEYPLNWHGYPVAFHFEYEGHIHHARYESLAEMYAAQQRGETVVLLREPEN